MTFTVTNAVEHAFCPKFSYYSLVLGLPQYESKRGTVLAGREYHARHELSNRKYVLKGNGRKITNVKLFSEHYDIIGIIDEAIETDDEIILVERKYSDYARITATIITQIGLLSILAEENYHKPVRKAIVIFQKRKRIELMVDLDESIKAFALNILNELGLVIESGVLPESRYDNRCLNCCYRKICPVGSLKIRQYF